MQPIDSIREYGVNYITNNVQVDIVFTLFSTYYFEHGIFICHYSKNINASNFN